MKITIGIDPDSMEHGVAIYKDNTLFDLKTMQAPSIINRALTLRNESDNIIFSIENVAHQNFIYSRNEQSNKAKQAKVGLSVGRCQQAQVELMRWLSYYSFDYVVHKPQKGNWADNKDLFERLTGWTGRSSKDKRSAAFFGYLEIRSNITAY